MPLECLPFEFYSALFLCEQRGYQGGQQTAGNGSGLEVAKQGVLSCEARHTKGVELATLDALSRDGEKFFRSLY